MIKSDIIYNIEDNKPIFKLAPFFLNGNQKRKKNKNNQLQIIKSLINKLYFNQDSAKITPISDEELNDLLIKLSNNKLNMKHYINHKFFISDKNEKEIKNLIKFNETFDLGDLYKLNEEYYLLRYKNIIKIFPKIIYEYKFDFDLNFNYMKYFLLKKNVLLVICFEYYLF